MAGPTCPSNNRMEGKVVLVTGASRGIGFETAKELAKRGATIILVCKNFQNGQQALFKIKNGVKSPKVDLRIVDLCEMNNIREFVAVIERNYKKIDVLVNNAAVIHQPFKKSMDGFETTLAINYLAPFLLTHLLLPLLKKSENGRIVNISATAHFNSTLNLNDLNLEKRYDEREAFCQSKLALVMFTRHMAEKLKGTGIIINAVNPGLVRNTGHIDQSSLNSSFLSKMITFPWAWLFLKTPKQGCQTTVFACVDPVLRNVSGAYLSDCDAREPSHCAQNKHMCEMLYKVSCKMCKIEGEEVVSKLFI